MNIEKNIQSLLYKISSEINVIKSPKRLFGLYEDACQLVVYARAMNLNIKIPPKILEYYNNWFYDILPDKFKNNYFNFIINSIFENEKTDKILDTVAENIFYNYNCETILGKSLIFTKEETINLALKFFEYYDKDMHKHAKKMLDNGHIHFTSKNNVSDEEYAVITGITCTAYSQSDSFILVGGKKDITFVATIIHEIIHSYVDSLNYNMTFDQRMNEMTNCLYEVITYFSASAFRHYLQEIYYDKNTIDFLESNTCNIFLMAMGSFLELSSSDFDEFECIASSAYGNLLAFHYFDKYLIDSEKTKDDILNMTLASKDYKKPYILDNYGLSLDELKETNILEKRLNKNYRY